MPTETTGGQTVLLDAFRNGLRTGNRFDLGGGEMRLMSFSMTTLQVVARMKTVTRRRGETWRQLRAGDRLRAVHKSMGLRRGEHPEDLAVIEVVDVREEPLDAITADDVAREGYPTRDPAWFVERFERSQRGGPDQLVRRIEFRYLERVLSWRANGNGEVQEVATLETLIPDHPRRLRLLQPVAAGDDYQPGREDAEDIFGRGCKLHTQTTSFLDAGFVSRRVFWRPPLKVARPHLPRLTGELSGDLELAPSPTWREELAGGEG